MDRTARFTGASFKQILDRNGGAGLGFDLLRLGLALLVLLSHGSSKTGHGGTTAMITEWLHNLGLPVGGGAGPPDAAAYTGAPATVPRPGAMAGGDPAAPRVTNGITGPFIRALVPMFFALSGFLVTGSALRTRSLVRFLGLRTLRILPALFVEVFLSAILLGAVFTNLPLRKYFSHPDFYSYFLNIVGDIHFFLPGVFQNNLTSVVNANLWTIPYELECYGVMSLFIVLGLLGRRLLFTGLFLAFTAVLVFVNMRYGYMAEMGVYGGRALVFCFAVGVLFYLWRDRIVFHWALFLASGVVAYVLLRHANTIFVAPFFMAYMTVFIGLMPLPQYRIVKSGDYSYGVYLYGYPVTQALVAVLGPDGLPFWIMMLVSCTLTLAFAALSWHGVEKHFLKLKRFLSPSSAKVTQTLHPDIVPATDGSEPAPGRDVRLGSAG